MIVDKNSSSKLRKFGSFVIALPLAQQSLEDLARCRLWDLINKLDNLNLLKRASHGRVCVREAASNNPTPQQRELLTALKSATRGLTKPLTSSSVSAASRLTT